PGSSSPTNTLAAPPPPSPSAAELQELKALFGETFGPEPGAAHRTHVVRAPGRVNLIGEHTDYNDGFVFPMAIEPEVRIVCRARSDGLVRIASTAFTGEIAEFSVQQKVAEGKPKWSNYSRGVAGELLQAGVPLPGMD